MKQFHSWGSHDIGTKGWENWELLCEGKWGWDRSDGDMEKHCISVDILNTNKDLLSVKGLISCFTILSLGVDPLLFQISFFKQPQMPITSLSY